MIRIDDDRSLLVDESPLNEFFSESRLIFSVLLLLVMCNYLISNQGAWLRFTGLFVKRVHHLRPHKRQNSICKNLKPAHSGKGMSCSP